MTENARSRQLAKDHGAPDHLQTCPRCGDLCDAGTLWCPGCRKWLRLDGPTASDLHSRRMQALHYPPHQAEAVSPDKERERS